MTTSLYTDADIKAAVSLNRPWADSVYESQCPFFCCLFVVRPLGVTFYWRRMETSGAFFCLLLLK